MKAENKIILDRAKKELSELMASFPSIVVKDISVERVSDSEFPEWEENVLELKVEGESEEIMQLWDALANRLKMLVLIRW